MTVKRVEVLAYAKINLMLDIIRRRTDGYHDLFMIMQSVGVADRVTVEREPGRKLRLRRCWAKVWRARGDKTSRSHQTSNTSAQTPPTASSSRK